MCSSPPPVVGIVRPSGSSNSSMSTMLAATANRSEPLVVLGHSKIEAAVGSIK
jgi:hypothetical protein